MATLKTCQDFYEALPDNFNFTAIFRASNRQEREERQENLKNFAPLACFAVRLLKVSGDEQIVLTGFQNYPFANRFSPGILSCCEKDTVETCQN